MLSEPAFGVALLMEMHELQQVLTNPPLEWRLNRDARIAARFNESVELQRVTEEELRGLLKPNAHAPAGLRPRLQKSA